MKRLSLTFEAARKLSLREEETPRPKSGEVLVATELSAISPGTELLIYRGQAPAGLSADATLPSLAGDLTFPLKYGYAAVGRVIEIGDGIQDSWLGRRVFAFHPHETRFTIPAADVVTVPEDIAAEDAALLPNVETAVNFLMDGQPVIGERVAVFGQGIVGLLTTALLSRFPLADLVTVDSFPRRREASLTMGAGAALDPSDPNCNQRLRGDTGGVDLAYELSGNPAALDQALAVTGFAGRVVVGSWYGSKRASLDLGGAYHRSRIRLLTSQVSTLDPQWSGRWTKERRLASAWEMIRRVRPSRLITHRLQLTEAVEAYRLLDERPEEAVQVIFQH